MKPERFYLQTASLSDPGKVRLLNEDAVAVDRELGYAVVTDGMGGHRAGDVASQLALRILIETLARHPRGRSIGAGWCEKLLEQANCAIIDAAKAKQARQGMGATLAMARFGDRQVTLAHVGDARIYRLRGGVLELLTRDDSLINDELEAGLIDAENVGDSHNRHFVTRALGAGGHVAAHVREEALCAGDVYLLCSDGLTDLVEDKDIENIVDSLKTNLPLTASHLVQLANDNGGYDNVTVALVRVLDEASVARPERWFSPWLRRLFG